MNELGSPIDVAELVTRLAAQAIDDQIWEYTHHDRQALHCLHVRETPLQDRVTGLRGWLDYYKVLQGFTDIKRVDLAQTVLIWADRRDLSMAPTFVKEIGEAHADLMSACCVTFGKKREFTSLASKALWLCYPDSVPIFDKYVERSVQLLAKFEPDIPPADSDHSDYEVFVHYWKQLYERYGDALRAPVAERDLEDILHTAKTFDAVLWLISEPRYSLKQKPRRSLA